MGTLLQRTSRWQQGTQQVLSLFLSGPCPLCQRSTATPLCPACQRQVGQSRLSNPLDSSHAGLPVVSWGRYEDSLRQVIRQLKYSGQPGLAQWLGSELGQTWLHYQAGLPSQLHRSIVIMPIPLHASKLQQRGFNQAELLARWVSRMAQAPLVADGLLRVQATQAQHSLNRQQRQENLAQAFQVNPRYLDSLRQKTVWLVDDIFTTGATAQSAARILRQSGVSVAGICTVARAGLQTDQP
jgi:ComF family protein